MFVPGTMSAFASGIAITPKQEPNAIGAHGCCSDLFRAAGATEARESEYHQVNSNSLLLLIFGSIKFLRIGIKLR